ncbi:hypothetical protein [Dawidia soli]|uniref:Uncharacterized protein n=1 Tax=Dawidia soli TaxID=2782352 RepID=A0AAP2DFN6_9BACT|nr:hypothetical protein [Dawidia soli]MBT1689830.1 hypothetical protein [Dawidia soli]
MKRWIDAACVLLLGTIALYWLTYVETIGLHGDEAWGGLDGIKILQQGISRPYGIVTYTGLLQSLANAAAFRLFSIDVVALRMPGILFNIFALAIVVWFLRKRYAPSTALFFLLFFGQSAFYLLYGKISWEVCSFNFLFTSLFLVSGYQVYTSGGRAWCFVFLSVCLLGGYNHIIFSCLPLAAWVGIVVWTLFGKESPSETMPAAVAALFLAVLNSGLLYLCLRADLVWHRLGRMFFLLPFLLIVAECFLLHTLAGAFGRLLRRIAATSVHEAFKIALLVVCFLSFSKFHGALLVKIYSQKIVLFHILSYQIPLAWGVYLLVTGCLLVGLLYYLLVKDILYKNSPATYVLIVYLGLLNVYTAIPSMRYLLIAGVLLFLYISLHLVSERAYVRYGVAGVLIVNLVIVQGILWRVNGMSGRQVTAGYFMLNDRYRENSAHFLNFSPVLDFIHRHTIGAIQTRDDFFIGNVFQFYRHADPSIRHYHNAMELNYDYLQVGSGFEMRPLGNGLLPPAPSQHPQNHQ